MPSETLNIIVQLKDRASRNLTKLGTGLKGIRNTVKSVADSLFSLKGAIAGALGGATLGLLSKSFLNAASSAEQYRTRLNVLLKSQSEGNRLFKEMSEFASTVSFSYEEIMGSATNLAGVMRGGVDEIRQWMPGIANLAAASGLSIQDTTSQIIRMYSAGAASADLFRERGVTAMLGFTAGVSYSAEETRKRLMQIFEDPNSQIAGAATELAKTWDGMLSMIGDAWFQFRNLVMESGVFDYLKSAVQLFLDFIGRLKAEGRLEEWAKSLADGVLKSFGVILKGIGLIADAWRGWQMIWQVLKIAYGSFAKVVNLGLEQIALGVEKIMGGVTKRMAEFGRTLQSIPRWINPTLRGLGDVLANADKIAVVSGAIAENARDNAEYWDKVVTESTKELDVLARQGSAYDKLSALHDTLLAKTRAALELTKKQREEVTAAGAAGPTGAPTPEVSVGAILASQLSRGKEAMRTSLADLQALYAQGEVTLAEYFARRKDMVVKQFELELNILEQQRLTEEDVDKRLAIEDKIFALRQAHHRELLAMTEEQRQAEESLAEDRLRANEMVKRATETGLDAIKDGTDQAYAYSGDKIKEFFYVSKAASVAQTVMSTYEAAQEAYKALAGIPIVGPALGVAAAAGAVAQGLARVAMVRNQRLAGGGEVEGHSPHSKADNIGIMATAGEFMQPVSAVRYYGKAAMEALRRKAIPREIFSGFALPQPRHGAKYAYATGGPVVAPTAPTQGQEIKILNYVDQNEMLAALGSPEGEDAVINVISRRREKVAQVLR